MVALIDINDLVTDSLPNKHLNLIFKALIVNCRQARLINATNWSNGDGLHLSIKVKKNEFLNRMTAKHNLQHIGIVCYVKW